MAVFRSDPCGIACFIITYAAVIYADYVVVRHMVLPTMSESLWGAVHVMFFNICIFLLVISHLRAVLSDPGIVPLPQKSIDFSDLHSGSKVIDKDGNNWSVCMKCETYRPPRAHHCRICRRCIRRMDHHCPWINNCVGEYNQKFFLQFLFYVGIASVYAVSLVVASWVTDPEGKSAVSKQSRILHTIILIVECLMFALFVIAIGCDQLSAILNDATLVEQVKKEAPQRQPKSNMSLLAEIFGRGHPALWLCPLQFNSDRKMETLPYDV